jgi:hypothetical protein
MAAVTVEPGRTVDWSTHNSTRVADSARISHCPAIQHSESNNLIQRMEESKGTPSPLSNASAGSLASFKRSDCSGRAGMASNRRIPGPSDGKEPTKSVTVLCQAQKK